MTTGRPFPRDLIEAVRAVARQLHVPVMQLRRSQFVEIYGSRPRDVGHRWGELRRAAAASAICAGEWQVPGGHHVKGVSALVGSDGKIKAQWVKTSAGGVDPEELVRRLGEVVLDEITQRTSQVPAPRTHDGWEDVLAIYPVGDPHIGLYAAERECGAAWDITRATRVFRAAIDDLSVRGAPAQQALLIDLGDGLHADSERKTTTKGTPQDHDGRWWEAVMAAMQLRIYMIDRLLEQHERVTAWTVSGNHDRHSSLAVQLALAHHYRLEPRAEVVVDPAPFRFLRHGECLIGATHGDMVSPAKSKQLALLMAERRAADWGQTRHRRWFVGHVHHRTVREEIGCEIETLRTLARPDAWTTREGYVSRRDMRRYSFHARWGEIGCDVIGGFELERFESDIA